MKARRAARRLAVDVLYESEIRDRLPVEAFAERKAQGWVVPTLSDDDTEPHPPETEPSSEALAYAEALVRGVQDHHADIDFLIGKYADRWTIERMPVVDRTLLRMAMFELLWGGDTPVAVAINEAVELAKALSTEDSGRFINGLLGKVVDQERAG
jgi:transcription antitermination protein NusB